MLDQEILSSPERHDDEKRTKRQAAYQKKHVLHLVSREKDMESEGVSRSTTEQELLGKEICFIC